MQIRLQNYNCLSTNNRSSSIFFLMIFICAEISINVTFVVEIMRCGKITDCQNTENKKNEYGEIEAMCVTIYSIICIV